MIFSSYVVYWVSIIISMNTCMNKIIQFSIVALTRKIDMQLNESYKPSTRDDSNARIQAVVLSSKMGHHSHQ